PHGSLKRHYENPRARNSDYNVRHDRDRRRDRLRGETVSKLTRSVAPAVLVARSIETKASQWCCSCRERTFTPGHSLSRAALFMRYHKPFFILVLHALFCAGAFGDVVSVSALKDNTLYENTNPSSQLSD